MDKLTLYRQYIIEILTDYAQKTKNTRLGDAEFDEQLLIDTQHDHYQLLTVGWEGIQRIYYPVFHIDIKNDKIWIQEDATDFDIVGIFRSPQRPKIRYCTRFLFAEKTGFDGLCGGVVFLFCKISIIVFNPLTLEITSWIK